MRISDGSSDVCSSDLIAASAGNHALGLAYHGKRLGVPVTIVMPKTTPQGKVSQTASHGATIVLFGEKCDDAYAHARKLETVRGVTFRSERRRVGKECVRKCGSRGAPNT